MKTRYPYNFKQASEILSPQFNYEPVENWKETLLKCAVIGLLTGSAIALLFS